MAFFHLQVPLFQGYPAHPERRVLQNLSNLAGQYSSKTSFVSDGISRQNMKRIPHKKKQKTNRVVCVRILKWPDMFGGFV